MEPKVEKFVDGGTSTAVVDLLAPERRRRTFKNGVTDPKKAVKLNRLPEVDGKTKNYILSLHEKCPLEVLHILGLTFSLYSSEPRRAMDRDPKQVFPIVPLSDNMVDAIRIKAASKELKWREADGTICKSNAGEFIILREFADGDWPHLTPVDMVASRALSVGTSKMIVDKVEYEAFLKHKEAEATALAEAREKKSKSEIETKEKERRNENRKKK